MPEPKLALEWFAGMGNFLHKQLSLKSSDVVEVELDRQANVLLLDTANFQNYRNGGNFNYIGCHATVSPVRLSPTSDGTWYIVIDLGGAGGTINYSVNVISG
ncbi:MAG: DUF1883 domain-containing protein [Planctomycetaceae bacterium]|nr:DUF1883 domain-containing protein [Planctomycetaceae bacterium]